MIKAVFLDLYGTLVLFDPPREEVQVRACEPFGFQLTRDGLVKGYLAADEWLVEVNATHKPLPLMDSTERDHIFAGYEQLILHGAGIEIDLDIAGRVWDRVQEIPHGLTLFEDVLPLLELLKARELTVGTLTNIGWDIDVILKDLDLVNYLDFVVTSSEVGVGKPHPAMFLDALERANVSPDETLMIGDSYRSDVQGAIGVGIQPFLLDREGVMSVMANCIKIASLMDILDYI